MPSLRIMRVKKAATRASASASGSSCLIRHAWPLGVMRMILLGALISAVCVGFGRFRSGRLVMIVNAPLPRSGLSRLAFACLISASHQEKAIPLD